MRTHKYRGLTEKGEWVKGYYLTDGERHWIIDPQETDISSLHMMTLPEGEPMALYEVRSETVGESLGKHDKNNQEIFERDYLKVHYEDLLGIECGAIGVIQKGEFWWELDFPQYGSTIPLRAFWTDEPDDFEVVGNEVEEPDKLLEGKP